MPKRTVHHLTWTIRWIRRQPSHHDESQGEEQQPPAQPLVIVIVQESWSLHWADETETQPLANATE